MRGAVGGDPVFDLEDVEGAVDVGADWCGGGRGKGG